jgi:hypothetical protein
MAVSISDDAFIGIASDIFSFGNATWLSNGRIGISPGMWLGSNFTTALSSGEVRTVFNLLPPTFLDQYLKSYLMGYD